MSDEPDNSDTPSDVPADQGGTPAKVGPGHPPVEHQFPPGKSGNPKGRPKAGASIREWMNRLAELELPEVEIRTIVNDPKAPWTKRAAAVQCLQSFEHPDLADFAGLQRGENNLEDLRGMGVRTDAVKKFKQKSRKVPVPGEDGAVEEIIEREIELHDRAGPAMDRIMDRTEGRPKQQVDVTSGDQTLRTLTDGQASADQVLDRLRGLLNARPADPA